MLNLYKSSATNKKFQKLISTLRKIDPPENLGNMTIDKVAVWIAALPECQSSHMSMKAAYIYAGDAVVQAKICEMFGSEYAIYNPNGIGAASCFTVIKNYESQETYRVECRIVIYREKLKRHPEFLEPYQGDRVNGFNTKFWLLIEDNIPDKDKAYRLCTRLNELYAAVIRKAENTGNWAQFPFKNCTVTYYK